MNCKKCGRIIGKTKHICPTKKELQDNAKQLQTPEAKAKASVTRKKLIAKGEWKGLFKNEKEHINWKGDEVKYQGLHKWLREHKPKPEFCERCNKKPKDLANISGLYKRDINDYEYLCRSCHLKADREVTEMKKLENDEIKDIHITECDEDFYDLSTETENFIAEGIVVHNCRPSRKSRALGVYLPDTLKENLNITVAIDVSGSIGDKEYQEFISEMVGISKSFENVVMNCLFWDTEVTSDLVMKNGNIKIIEETKVCGYGGTTFNCVSEYLKENRKKPNLMVVFTDGYIDDDYAKPECKTLWVITERGSSEICKKREENYIELKGGKHNEN